MSNRSGKSNCNSFEIPRSQETMDRQVRDALAVQEREEET
jgi:hypothetical protein